MRSLNRSSKRKSSSSDTDIKKMNFKLVIFLIILIAIGVLSQAFRWQIIQGDKYANLAKAQYLESKDRSTIRGVIYANDGTVLAVDEPVWDVYASLSSLPSERELFFDNKEQYITTISAILGIKQEEIRSKLTDKFMYVKLKEGISVDKKKALEQAEIFPNSFDGYYTGFGLHFEKKEQRVYPNGKLASHILGFIGKDSKGDDLGQYGIEGFYFSDILGQKGYTYEEKDSIGNVILTSEYDPILPREGKSFKLTINPIIQMKVEEALKQGVQDQQAKSGSAIIMDPNTGAILALANYPDYNPNEYWKTSQSWIYRNKAIADVYEYGSIHKPITIAIGLESGQVKEDYICNDKTGSVKLYDKTIYTWNKVAGGKLTLGQMLEKSNNPCLVEIALKTGFTTYYPKLSEFGLGQFLGIGLQDEANGYLRAYEQWTKLDLATTSFGQSISATPLQVISALSPIANEGKRMRPYIISEVIEKDETIKISPQVISTPISSKTAKLVAEMMEGVIKNGDPKQQFDYFLPNYDIAGKTGTAQIPRKDGPGYYDDRTNATFVGFAPTNEAKMIMLVRMEEPKTSTFAALTAVPVWINIFKAVADDLEIPRVK